MAFLGRTAGAAPLTSADIPDGSVTTAKLIDSSVTSAKIGVDVIVAEDIANNAVTVAELADNAVTQAKLADDAVGTAELANDVAISTTGAITTTGAFTSIGIDDNSNALAMTIDANERVGIGTSSPDAFLDIEAADSYMRFTSTGGTPRSWQVGGSAVNDTNRDFFIQDVTAGANRLVINSSGNVGIGTATPTGDLHISESGAAEVRLQMTNSATGQTSTDGTAIVMGADGTSTYIANYESAGNVYTYVNGDTRMTVNYNGNVGINTTVPDCKLHVEVDEDAVIALFKSTSTGGGPAGLKIHWTVAQPDNSAHWFLKCTDGGADEAHIYSNGSFVQASDRRLKENIVDVESMLDKVNSLRVVNYNRINDVSKGLHIGAIAQEIDEIFPHLVTVSPAVDAIEEVRNAEGNITIEAESARDKTLMVYKIGLIYPVIKAVQELSAKNDALEARILTLENA